MDSSSIRLAGSEIHQLRFAEATLRVEFSRAYIVKTMTGSAEKTLWWQAGELVLTDAELLEPTAEALSAMSADGEPLVCAGGDVDENIYTYRDMIPIPLDSRGHCACDLKLAGQGSRIRAQGAAIRLEMRDTPRYIEHIRDEQASN